MPRHDQPSRAPADKAGGCLFAVFALLERVFTPRPSAPERLPYARQDYLLTKAEHSFYRVLQQAIGTRYTICPMVRLADIVKVTAPRDAFWQWFNRISAKHVDFVLCDPRSMRPVIVVELDDGSHGRQDRQDRDAFVDRVLADAGLPLLRVPAQRSYNTDQLAADVAHVAAANTPGAPATPQTEGRL